MGMKTSARGVEFISTHEGFAARVYNDHGHPAIGFGHDLRPGESFPDGITREQALALLASDVAWAEAAVNANVRVPLTQGQFDALVDFTYNEGSGAFAGSTTLRLLNAGDYAGAEAALAMWTKDRDPNGVLVTDPVLTARRRDEQALFEGQQ